MQRKPEAFLWDISEAAARVREFVADLDFPAFSSNAMVQAAVERQFEIIGEALSQLSRVAPEMCSQIPDVGRIIAFRNILIHGYAVLDRTIVRSVIQDHRGPESDGRCAVHPRSAYSRSNHRRHGGRGND